MQVRVRPVYAQKVLRTMGMDTCKAVSTPGMLGHKHQEGGLSQQLSIIDTAWRWAN